MAEGIPADVQRFVQAHIDSIEQLEILMLLHESPERDWSTAELNRQIRSREESIEKRVAGLVEVGFVAATGGAPRRYRLGAPSAAVRTLIDGLAQAYRDFRPSLIALIVSRPSDRVMGFARAFDLRPRKLPPESPPQ